MYGCQLWRLAFGYSLRRLQVAHNDAFRVLLNVSRLSSASSLFVSHGVAKFGAVIRKFIFSLNDCMRKTSTSNSILAALLNSDIFITSTIVRKWHNLLYVHCASWGCHHKLNTFNIFASFIQLFLTLYTYNSCIITFFYVHRPQACYWINNWLIGFVGVAKV